VGKVSNNKGSAILQLTVLYLKNKRDYELFADFGK